MAAVLFSNNASASLAASISSSATTVTVTTGQGGLFPAISGGNFFYATLTDSSNNLEIVKVTGRTTDSMTVVRAQEGTTARAYAAADKLELRVTAAVLNNFPQLIADQTFSGANTFSSAPTFSTALAVSSGGTGSTTGTGTGLPVFATSPTLVTPTLGTPASGTLTNCGGDAANLRAGAVKTTNFTIEESGGKLVFKNGTTVIASLDSTGNLVTAQNITAYGSP
jgi:hypothetical protein